MSLLLTLLTRFFVFVSFIRHSLSASSNATYFDFIGSSGVILAIGDGLTSGKVLHRSKGKEIVSNRRYPEVLETKLTKNGHRNKLITITQYEVTLSPQLLQNTMGLINQDVHVPYKAAIIFSGHDEIVNFYGFNDSPNTIAHNVHHIHEYFHSYVSESKSTDRVSFIVTLPEFKSTARPKMKADRLQLNRLFRNFQSRCQMLQF